MRIMNDIQTPQSKTKTALSRWLGLALALFLAAGCSSEARDITAFYSNNCAACHGINLQGGTAPSLLTNVWTQGADDVSIARAISEGNPTKGMPAWKEALTAAEIRAMVVLLREKIAKAQSETNAVAKPIDGEVVTSAEHKFRFKTVTENLDHPWSIAFLPDGRMLVTELPGRLRIVEQGKLLTNAVSGTPKVRAQGQGGLMDVAVHPDYATNGWVYLSYAHGATVDGKEVSMTAIVRGRIKDNQWTDEQTVFRAAQDSYLSTGFHYGCRLVFDDRGHLFFSIGDRGIKEHAQDLTLPNGKIHRVSDDGRIPSDNPFVGYSNAMSSIWTYGNRNPQGLVRHPQTGELWETEHGPRGGDELNLILRGRNYGWPVITFGMDYNGTPITALTAKEGMEQPLIHWTPSIAVCGMDFYFGNEFPRWEGNLFVTALAQQELRRVLLDGQRVVKQEVLFKNIGRVRDVCTGPDGLIYLALNRPNRIIRLEPVK
jgi:glucose/arabinose dehydrogenase